MKKIAWLLIFAMLLPIFAGCGEQEAYVPTGNALADADTPIDDDNVSAIVDNETEFFNLAYYPEEGFNPYLCTNINNRMLFSLLYQGLFALDKDNHAVPILCKSLTVSSDLKSYTIYLESATFSDGTALRADDVIASLEYARDSDIYAGRFDQIDSFYAVGENAIQIDASIPYENLPMLLDIPIVKASQVGESQPLGTGPYELAQTASGMNLQRRNNWWCSATLPLTSASIPLIAAESTSWIRDQFEFNDLGISISDPGSASYAECRSDYELWEVDTGLFVYLGIRKSSELYTNEKIRGALTYAIDRAALLRDCYGGFGSTATIPVSPTSVFYDRGLGSQGGYSREKFRQAVKDAGMVGENVILLVNKSDSVRVRAAKMIATMLEECGLTVTLEDWSSGYYKSKLSAGDFDLYVGQTKLSPTMDLTQFFAPYGELSYGGMDNAACYTLAKSALENSGNFYNLNQLVQSEGQMVPILFRTYAVYAKRGLSSTLSPARDNIFYYSLGKTLEDVMTIDYGDEE